MSNPHDPVFPITPEIWATHPDFFGLTKREWFAGQAIGAVIRQCANDALFGFPDGVQAMEDMFACKAFAIADAMIAEGRKGQ